MIRRVRPDDAAACSALVQAGLQTYRAFAPEGWEPFDATAPEAVSGTAARFAEPAAYGCVDVPPAGGIDGVAFWRPPDPNRVSRDGWLPDAHLQWLFVAEHRWGDGLARRLHALAVQAMHERGMHTARLFTPHDHARARGFYEREGWRQRLDPYLDEAMGLELVEYELHVGSGAT